MGSVYKNEGIPVRGQIAGLKDLLFLPLSGLVNFLLNVHKITDI